MIFLTKNEREAMLIIFKEFSSYYNANSISKVLHISHVGAQKIFKRLLQENIVVSKTIGKSIIYKINFSDNYTSQLLAFLLADEANNFKRWKEEFKELFKNDRIVMLFGSVVKDYAHANDIDVMIVIETKENKEINDIVKKKQDILPKKLHAIKLTHQDMLENLKKRDKAMIDIVKNAVILYGQNTYVEMLKNVTSF